MAEYNWWDDRTIEDNDEHFCPLLNNICYGDDNNCQECEVQIRGDEMTEYEKGYKDGMAGAALPNIIDNGDKIDGYAYSYKTDSDGIPYINIECVRAMLTKATNTQPIRHGQWIITDDVEHFIAVCSECGRTEDSRDIKDMPYCHCGARMIKDGDTE